MTLSVVGGASSYHIPIEATYLSSVLPWSPGLRQDLNGKGEGGEEQARKLRDFFTALALCHTVIPERFEDTDEVCASSDT